MEAPAAGSQRSSQPLLRQSALRRAALFGSLVVAMVAGGLLFVSGSPTSTTDRTAQLAPSAFEEKTGVRVALVGLTAGTGLVDFRFQVIDPEKATVVHQYPPFLVDERTGKVIDSLFMGHSHQGELKTGYTYPLLFVNEQGVVKLGGLVSIIIGDARLEHVSVH
jgi:hypothetical protein